LHFRSFQSLQIILFPLHSQSLYGLHYPKAQVNHNASRIIDSCDLSDYCQELKSWGTLSSGSAPSASSNRTMSVFRFMHAYINAVLPSVVLGKKHNSLGLAWKQKKDSISPALEVYVRIAAIQGFNDLMPAVVGCNSERCMLICRLPANQITCTSQTSTTTRQSKQHAAYPSIAGMICPDGRSKSISTAKT
jgi:hypothetical protein